MANKVFLKKLKHKILHELNINLYKKFNMTIAEIDSLFGYYNGHIFQLVDHIYRRYGPHGLRKEIKYILEYLEFLLKKLKNNNNFSIETLVYHYFNLYYLPYFKRKKIDINQLNLPLDEKYLKCNN